MADLDDWQAAPEQDDWEGPATAPAAGPPSVWGAAVEGAKEGFGSAPLGLDDVTRGSLDKVLPQAVTDQVIDPLYTAGNAVVRGIGAAYHGLQAGAIQAGVPRDIASLPDAFMGSPGHFSGMPMDVPAAVRMRGAGSIPGEPTPVPPTPPAGIPIPEDLFADPNAPTVAPGPAAFTMGSTTIRPTEGSPIPAAEAGPRLPDPVAPEAEPAPAPAAAPGTQTAAAEPAPATTTFAEPPVATVDPNAAALDASIEATPPPPPPLPRTLAEIQKQDGVMAPQAGRIRASEVLAFAGWHQQYGVPMPPIPDAGEPTRDQSIKKAELGAILADPRSADQIEADKQTATNARLAAASQALPQGFTIQPQSNGWLGVVDPRGAVLDQVPGGHTSQPDLDQLVDAAHAHLATGADYSDLTRVGTGTAANPVKVFQPTDIAAAGQSVATPTPGQAAAGNYQMGHINVGGLNISIENPAGSVRSGIGPDGNAWSVQMPADYGYIKGTDGADSDHVDVSLGPEAHVAHQHQVYVIDQRHSDNKQFDEHKAMIGFPTQEAALHAYTSSFSDGRGPARVGAVTPMPWAQFRQWVRKGDHKKPVAYKPPAPEPAPPQGQIVSLDPHGIRIDAKRFQFKAGGNEHGVSERLAGVKAWDPIAAGASVVFRDKDGTLYIADGHQRLALAQRLSPTGQPPVPFHAFVLDSKDGFTDADARQIAAVKNIAEGSGTALDAAKVLREIAAGNGGVVPALPPRSALVRDARGVAALGPEAFGMAINEVVPIAYSAIIGRLVSDAAQQVEAVRLIGKMKPATAMQAEMVVRDMLQSGTDKTIQSSLFGDEETTTSVVLERARIIDLATGMIRRDRAVFATLVAESDRIASAGNQLDHEANTARANESERASAVVVDLATHAGPVSDALTTLARKVKAGDTTLRNAARSFVDVIRNEGRPQSDGGVDDGGGRPGAEEPVEDWVGPDHREHAAAAPDAVAAEPTEPGVPGARRDDAEAAGGEHEQRPAADTGAEGGSSGVAAPPPKTETVDTLDGKREQTLIPGVEPITDRDRLAVLADKPLSGGNEPPGGLFAPSANQTDMRFSLGPVLGDFKGRYLEAVRVLDAQKSGVAEDALSHPDVGPIDLIWGEPGATRREGFGLSHIIAWHPEVIADLPARIATMQVASRSENRINLRGDGGRAGIRLDWDGNSRHWLITAFDEAEPRRSEKFTGSLDDLLSGRLAPHPGRGNAEVSTAAPKVNEIPSGWGAIEGGQDEIAPKALAAAVAAVEKITGGKVAISTNESGAVSLDSVGRRLIGPHHNVQGYAIGRIILAALGPATDWTLHHEAIHALRNLGVLTPSEWNTLASAAKRFDWGGKFNIGERYAGQGYAAKGEQALVEEAVADKFAQWATRSQVPKGRMALIWRKTGNFLDRLLNNLAGEGFLTAEDVFGKIASGEIGAREPGSKTPQRGPDTIKETIASLGLLGVIHPDMVPDVQALFDANGRFSLAPTPTGTPATTLTAPIQTRIRHTAALQGAVTALSQKATDFGTTTAGMVSPMTLGTDEARAIAKDYANARRLARDEGNRIMDRLGRDFTAAQLREMWDRADLGSVHVQMGRPSHGFGTDRLPPQQKLVVDALQDQANMAFEEARAVGIHNTEGLPSYVPRMVVDIGTPEGARVVRDIRTLALATMKLREAIAGRVLINNIRLAGQRVGMQTVSIGAPPGGGRNMDPLLGPTVSTAQMRQRKNLTREQTEESADRIPAADGFNWFTIKQNPAFWVNKVVGINEDGSPRRQRVPIWVRGDFEGPLRSVMHKPNGPIYKGLMDLKGRMMSGIMYGVAHLGVISGRILPAVHGNPLALVSLSREGFLVKQDPQTRERAIKAGLVPIGRQGGFTDAAGIDRAPNLRPGTSWTSQILAAVPGLVSDKAGDAVKRGVDKAGHFAHGTLLWDRVADMQFGLFAKIERDMLRWGASPKSAALVAAHQANRYAGALPPEAMSQWAAKVANVVLFSRTYRLGNFGAMKDALNGLPKDILAQIARDDGIQVMLKVKGKARRLAIATILIDMALFYAGNSLLQSAVNVMLLDKTVLEEAKGYADRLEAEQRHLLYESPVSALNPFGVLLSLTPMAEHEPGKDNRILVAYGKDGTAIYLRNPAGKYAEDISDYFTQPVQTLKRILSPYMHMAIAIPFPDAGNGYPVYDPYADTPGTLMRAAGDYVTFAIGTMLPTGAITAAANLATGNGTKADAGGILSGAVGLNVSHGYPGGPAQGERHAIEQKHGYEVQRAMPAIRKEIKAGDTDKATDGMLALGMSVSEIRYEIMHTLNPQAGARQIQRMMQHATPAQQAQFLRQRDAQPQAQAE